MNRIELNRTCCFEFNRMLRADSKRVLLPTFCFYFRLARFTSLSPLPEVDKGLCKTPIGGQPLLIWYKMYSYDLCKQRETFVLAIIICFALQE